MFLLFRCSLIRSPLYSNFLLIPYHARGCPDFEYSRTPNCYCLENFSISCFNHQAKELCMNHVIQIPHPHCHDPMPEALSTCVTKQPTLFEWRHLWMLPKNTVVRVEFFSPKNVRAQHCGSAEKRVGVFYCYSSPCLM